MATLTDLGLLKSDLNALVIKILSINGKEEAIDFYKQKLLLASSLEDIIKKHFETKAPDRLTPEQKLDIAVNGWRPGKWNM